MLVFIFQVPKVARQVAEWEKRVTQDNSKLSTDNISSNDTKRADSVETVSANEVQEQQWREQRNYLNNSYFTTLFLFKNF